MKSRVYFNYADRRLSLKGKTHVKSFVQEIFNKEKKSLERLDYIFCSDEYLLQVNKDFLKHDYYTDIITFDLSEGQAITGEIYISIDRIKENTITLQTNLYDEILRVIFHGVLHLCGYKDKTPGEIQIMRKMEEKYINHFKKVSRNTVSS